MLYSVPDMKRINEMPHLVRYRTWCQKLDQVDSRADQRIHDELDERFDRREVDTSIWIPSSDWTDTPYQDLYEACGRDPEATDLFFGLLVWQVVMDRADSWSFGRYEKNGIPIRGMTYFRIDLP